jgi:hypothetical protein
MASSPHEAAEVELLLPLSSPHEAAEVELLLPLSSSQEAAEVELLLPLSSPHEAAEVELLLPLSSAQEAVEDAMILSSSLRLFAVVVGTLSSGDQAAVASLAEARSAQSRVSESAQPETEKQKLNVGQKADGILLRMRSSLVDRAPVCQCTSFNFPGVRSQHPSAQWNLRGGR